ncbi:MAG: hypothetical protein M1828_001742 [Chrysothrix sp. TS-e1954]|nr:MAG: hypothetical protein M1828_001742 [Chrysothrix sp. TS-e1954]
MAGDFITIGPTASRAFEKWPSLHKAFHEAAYDTSIYYHKQHGEIGAGPRKVNETFGWNLIRPDLHKMLMDTVLAEGIEVRYLQHVVDYLETADKGGVKLSDGENLYADIVIAADGIRSKSWTVVTGEEPKTYSSGSAIFRCAYDTKHAMANPVLREKWDLSKHGETMHFFLGSVSHGIMLIGKEKICWGWMHRDDETTSTESWSAKLAAETALKQLKDDGEWASEYLAAVEATPPNSIIHWKLVWRDLHKDWVSRNGRVVQIGDAAHAFLPTSVNGGTQAFEDAVSLPCCLRIAVDQQGSEGIPMAVRVHNTLRLERVSFIQQLGFKRRHVYYNIDWEAVKKDPSIVAAEPAPWQYKHNPEQYALDRFEECRTCLETGTPFKNTNMPEHYKFEPWTVKDMENGAK